MALTKEQQKLVSEAWDPMSKKMSDLSSHLFTTICENDSSAMGMFSFTEDTKKALEKNDVMLADHAMKIFRQTKKLALGEAQNLNLKDLGFATLKKSVTDKHFQVLKKSLLSTVEKAMGKNNRTSEAWSEACNQFVAAIKAKMTQEAEASSSRCEKKRR